MQPVSHYVFSPISLPCGRVVSNRLAKVALYEHLANYLGGPPNEYHFALYEAWSKGSPGYGIVLTGNVQVTKDQLSLGRDIVLPDNISNDTLAPFIQLSKAIHTSSDSLAIMQLSHPGRQFSNVIGARLSPSPIAPSSVRVGSDIPWSNFSSKLFYTLLFQEPREMTVEDIERVIDRFVFGAELAHKSGFDGVQIHAAHGYLLAQFLSPKTNQRTDEFSVQNGNDLHLLHTIITRIRQVVPGNFVLGIKINAADYSSSSDDDTLSPKEERALSHIQTIAQWGGVDFIEISGGDYEAPDFVSARQVSKRQAFFSHISRKAIETLDAIPRQPDSPALPLIMLTGGLKSPALLHSALSSNQAHLLGIGRSSVLCPNIPAALKSLGDDDPTTWPSTPFAPEPDAPLPTWFPKIPLVGAGANVAWYEVQMRYLAEKVQGFKQSGSGDEYPDYGLTELKATLSMWAWRLDGGFFSKMWAPLIAASLGGAAVSYYTYPF